MPKKIKVDVNIAKISPQATEALVEDPLDDLEIRKALGNDAKIVPYQDLKNFRTIDDLLPLKKDAVMLLYENRPMDGHWCCLTKNKGEISFFDPYGEIVDKQLKYSQFSKDRVEGGADQSLHQLLSTSKLPVYYNDFKYQRDGNAVNTCGRHAINFIRYNQRHGLDLEDYNEMMEKAQKQSGLPYDELIAKLVPVHLPKEGEAPIVGSAKPNDPELYEKAKAVVYPRYKKPSAYRSGALVKEYKKMGGTFSDELNDKKPLKRWFKEEWADVGGLDYPTYRPTKRITKDTPLTASEISPEELAKQAILKQKIKGEKNLPAFKGKGRPLNAPNKTCAEKFLECVAKKENRKVRGKEGTYDPSKLISTKYGEEPNTHLQKLASLAILGKNDYSKVKEIVNAVKDNAKYPKELKKITPEEVETALKVKPNFFKNKSLSKYDIARQMTEIEGNDILNAVAKGVQTEELWIRGYDMATPKKLKTGVRVGVRLYDDEGGSKVVYLPPKLLVSRSYEEDNRRHYGNKFVGYVFDPTSGEYVGKMKFGYKKNPERYYDYIMTPEDNALILDKDYLETL